MSDAPQDLPEWAMEQAQIAVSVSVATVAQIHSVARALVAADKAATEREREHSTKLFWAAKEFIDDWKKGDFSLSTLAALDAQSLDDALATFSAAIRKGEQ
jgi:hypothetical protein